MADLVTLTRKQFERELREAKESAWDEGVIYGHNNEGRLIDKRADNPFQAPV